MVAVEVVRMCQFISILKTELTGLRMMSVVEVGKEEEEPFGPHWDSCVGRNSLWCDIGGLAASCHFRGEEAWSRRVWW